MNMNGWHRITQLATAHPLWRAVFLAALVVAAMVPILSPGVVVAADDAALLEEATVDYLRIIKQNFADWDHDHNSHLDIKDLDRMVENPHIAGAEAAAVVFVRNQLSTKADDGKPTKITLEKLIRLSADHKAMLAFADLCAHITATTHTVFLPNDPSLELFNQGHEGDCYLLSVVGAYLHRNPTAFKAMFRVRPANEVGVTFADGRKISVPAVTDAELLLGCKIGTAHGIWLSVMEKAWAIRCEEDPEKNKGKRFDPATAVDSDIIGHGGKTTPVIEALTGHAVEEFDWYKSEKDLGEERAADFLKRTTEAKMIITVATAAKGKAKAGMTLAPGMGAQHAYAVLGYDTAGRKVRVFNPWGNTFTPKGKAGLKNGYPTEHGVFEVPVSEFVHLYSRAHFETNKPLSAAPAPPKKNP